MSLSPQERKAMVKQRRGLQRRIARRLAVSESHLSLAIAGKRPASDRIKRAVARSLGLPLDEVFPREVGAE